MTAFDLPPDEDPVPIRVDSDGKQECPDCHKRLTVTQAGTIRSHKCGESSARTTAKRAPKGRKSKDVPANVVRVGTSGIAAGIEWGASHLVASYVPCRPDQVPADIPDAESMVGPLVKLVWPQLPARAQSIVSGICEQEDLILCALDWWAWGNKLKEFALQAHEIVKANREREQAQTQVQTQAQPSPTQTAVSLTHQERANNVAEKVGTNGIQGQTSVLPQARRIPGVEPFQPVSA